MSDLQPRCPRCGYDQAGILRGDAEAWPLESRCSECGLVIGWSAYFRETANQPRWWIEHCPLRRMPVAFILTVFVTFAGRPLWRRLRMAHPIRPLRLAAALLLLIILVPSLFFALRAVATGREMQRQIASRGLYIQIIESFDRKRNTVTWTSVIAEPVTVRGILHALSPLVLTPTSHQELHVSSHAVVPDPVAAHNFWVAVQAGLNPPPLIRSRQPVLVLTIDTTPQRFWSNGWRSMRTLGRFLFVTCAAATTAFICLPIARRRAKVRWAHLFRCTTYLLLGAWLFMFLPAWLPGVFAAPWWWEGMGRNMIADGRNLPVISAIAAFLFFWWYQATKHYLRMQRPAAVAGSVAALGILTGCTLELMW